MSIIINRVDDRLIHGQVVTSWIRGLNIQVVILVDDKISKDSTQISILNVSAPSGVKLYVLSIEEFIKIYNQNILSPYRVMLVFENISTPYELIKKGIPLESINLGGIRFKEGKRQIAKSLSISKEEEEKIRELNNLGIELEHRQLALDTKINIIDLL